MAIVAVVESGIVLDDAKLVLRPVRVPDLASHAPSIYLAALAPSSRRTMRHAIDKIAALLTMNLCDQWTLPWGKIRFQHVAAVRAVLAERYTVTYARKMMCALKGVLRCAWRLGQIPTEAFQRAIDVQPIRGESLIAGRAISAGEMRGLFMACAEAGGVSGVRDAALLGVLYGGGLRRSEIVGLDLGDYSAETGELIVRKGKGNKDRLVHIGAGGRSALDAWLEARGEEEGPLFLAVTKGGKTSSGKLTERRLTDQSVMDVLLKRSREAGIKPPSPHDFRRTFISDLLDAGADLPTVQKLAGHSNVSTTARYDRRGEGAKRRAAELLHIPFVPMRKHD